MAGKSILDGVPQGSELGLSIYIINNILFVASQTTR